MFYWWLASWIKFEYNEMQLDVPIKNAITWPYTRRSTVRQMSVFTMNWWWCTTSATISNRNSQCEFIVCGWQEKCVSLYIWLFIWSEVIRMTNQNLAHGLVVHKWQQGKNIAQFQMQCNTFEFEPLIHSKCIWNQHTHKHSLWVWWILYFTSIEHSIEDVWRRFNVMHVQFFELKHVNSSFDWRATTTW